MNKARPRRRSRSDLAGSRPTFPLRGGHAPARGGAYDAPGRFVDSDATVLSKRRWPGDEHPGGAEEWVRAAIQASFGRARGWPEAATAGLMRSRRAAEIPYSATVPGALTPAASAIAAAAAFPPCALPPRPVASAPPSSAQPPSAARPPAAGVAFFRRADFIAALAFLAAAHRFFVATMIRAGP
jgi:hypothetical protein